MKPHIERLLRRSLAAVTFDKQPTRDTASGDAAAFGPTLSVNGETEYLELDGRDQEDITSALEHLRQRSDLVRVAQEDGKEHFLNPRGILHMHDDTFPSKGVRLLLRARSKESLFIPGMSALDLALMFNKHVQVSSAEHQSGTGVNCYYPNMDSTEAGRFNESPEAARDGIIWRWSGVNVMKRRPAGERPTPKVRRDVAAHDGAFA